MVNKLRVKNMCLGVACVFLLSGCATTEEDTGKHATAVNAAEIPGDLTYQDVLQEGEHVQNVAMSPTTSRIWLSTKAGLYASASEKLWAQASSDVSADDIIGWLSDPQKPDRMYIVGNHFCKKSEDGGKTWKKVSGNFPEKGEVQGFTGGLDGKNLVMFVSVAGEGIYRSIDGGASWKLWQQPQQEITNIEYDEAEKKLYAFTQNSLLIYKGSTWETEDIPDAARIDSVAVSKQDHQLYVLTDKGVMVKHGGAWGPLESKLSETLVMISSGSQNSTLVAIGESSSIYTLTEGRWKKWE